MDVAIKTIKQSIDASPMGSTILFVFSAELLSVSLTILNPRLFPLECSDVWSISVAIFVSSVFYFFSSRAPQQLMLCLFIWLWGVRLASFLGRRTIEGFRDKRIDRLRKSNFMKFRWGIAQTVWISTLLFPICLAMTTDISKGLKVIDYITYLCFFVGFLLEAIADHQKSQFIKVNKSLPEDKRKPFIDHGLFRYSRFPNYFGEILMWMAISFSAFLVVESWNRLALPITPWLVFQVLDKFSIPPAVKSVKSRCTEKQFEQWLQTSPYVPMPPSSLES